MVSAMKPSRHQIAAGVTVVALGMLATVALASGGSGSTEPQSSPQPAAATPEVRFDEYRYFEPAFEWNVLEFKGKKLAVTICEDIWNMGDNPLYRITPMEKLMPYKPDVMINLSASPYNYAQDIVRNSIVKAHTLKYQLPMLYCNAIGSQTEIIFDGGSLVYDINGRKIKEMKYFEEDFEVFELDELLKKG